MGLVRSKQFKQLLEDPETPAIILLIILVDEYGYEFFEWEPETLRAEMRITWKVTPNQINLDKIWAIVVYLTTNNFTYNLDAFIHMCNSITGSGADFQVFDPATTSEIALTIAELTLLEPLEEPFDYEITAYVREQIKREGLIKPPKILEEYFNLDNLHPNLEALAGDEIDISSFWKSRMREKHIMEIEVLTHLQNIINILSSLELKNGDNQAIQELRKRALEVFSAEQKEVSEAQEVAPKTVSL